MVDPKVPRTRRHSATTVSGVPEGAPTAVPDVPAAVPVA